MRGEFLPADELPADDPRRSNLFHAPLQQAHAQLRAEAQQRATAEAQEGKSASSSDLHR